MSHKYLQLNLKMDVRPKTTSTVLKSLTWRLTHSLNYLNGGICFVLGSFMYYSSLNTTESKINGYLLGGWLFSIGSFSFLVSDLMEWFHFRIGCISDTDYPEPQTIGRTFTRASIGINFFISVTGSFLYLIGSICFIPDTNELLFGEYLFIYGSWIIFFSQFWKCCRTSFTNEQNLNIKFDLNNIKSDFPGFMVDSFAGLGGGFYAIGTYLFMLVETPNEEDKVTDIFVVGGLCFLTSGLFMQYRYYKSYPENPDFETFEEENN